MAGEAVFHGKDLLKMSDEEIRHVRGAQIAMIFQDPMTSLNPVMTIGKQLAEPLHTAPGHDRRASPRTARLNCWAWSEFQMPATA